MRKRVLTFLSLILLCFTLLSTKANADEIIEPINNTYKPGIYMINKSDIGKYNLQYEFLNRDKKSAIIVLDEKYDVLYKNINCARKCNAGTITNKNTIIVVGDEIAFYFSKI